MKLAQLVIVARGPCAGPHAANTTVHTAAGTHRPVATAA